MKNNKGITLIALVITIIVLLILAGVSIAMLTGNNGILTQANTAKTDTVKAEIAEKVNMAIQAVYADSLSPNPTYEGGVTAKNVATQYGKDNVGKTATATEGADVLTLTAEGHAVTLERTTAGTSFKAVTPDNVAD